MTSEHITLAHGNGGRFMRELIETIFVRHLANPELDTRLDAVAIPLDRSGTVVVTTDGFTVQPLEFPGGDIGALAIHGTVNDLAVAGATPCYLTLSAILEEGLELVVLERLVTSMAAVAQEAGVRIVAGDTKVTPRGHGGGVYFTTTGIGVRPLDVTLRPEAMAAGDCLLVSGPVGDHGTAVLLAREQFGLQGDVRSDMASLWPMTKRLRHLPGVRFMRDPTRGGLATVAHEIARMGQWSVRMHEAAIPIREPVQAVCELLGYDPLLLACEGQLVVVTSPTAAAEALRLMHEQGWPLAATIGHLTTGNSQVILETHLGGERFLRELEEDPLPRIC